MADESRDDTLRIVLRRRPHLDESVDVWEVVGTASGTKKEAIQKFAGKNGKDEPGTYRAPSLRAWKGEYEFEPDPEPRMKVTEQGLMPNGHYPEIEGEELIVYFNEVRIALSAQDDGSVLVFGEVRVDDNTWERAAQERRPYVRITPERI